MLQLAVHFTEATADAYLFIDVDSSHYNRLFLYGIRKPIAVYHIIPWHLRFVNILERFWGFSMTLRGLIDKSKALREGSTFYPARPAKARRTTLLGIFGEVRVSVDLAS